MTVRELMRALKKAKPDAIVTLRVGASDDYSPLTAIDEAQCTKNHVGDDGTITEQAADCIVLYLADFP